VNRTRTGRHEHHDHRIEQNHGQDLGNHLESRDACDAPAWWPCLPGRLAGRPRPASRLQPVAPDGERRLSDLLRELRVRNPGFSLSDVPLQAIAEQVAAGRLKAKPSRVFRFEEVREAHRVMEADEAKGKPVVVNT
jgi:Zinc-binding dehydrogenase